MINNNNSSNSDEDADQDVATAGMWAVCLVKRLFIYMCLLAVPQAASGRGLEPWRRQPSHSPARLHSQRASEPASQGASEPASQRAREPASQRASEPTVSWPANRDEQESQSGAQPARRSSWTGTPVLRRSFLLGLFLPLKWRILAFSLARCKLPPNQHSPTKPPVIPPAACSIKQAASQPGMQPASQPTRNAKGHIGSQPVRQPASQSGSQPA